MDSQYSSKEKREQAISWLWASFWLLMVSNALSIIGEERCMTSVLGISLGSVVLSTAVEIVWLIFILIFFCAIRLLLNLLLLNKTMRIEDASFLEDFSKEFKLFLNEAALTLERFKTCATGTLTRFFAKGDNLISRVLQCWFLYACSILLKTSK
jgi:hypothetical protein